MPNDSVHNFVQKNKTRIFLNLKADIEIASSTQHEQAKIKYLTQRLKNFGLKKVSIDTTGNAIGMIINKPSDKKFVLVSAHADTACEVPQGIEVKEQNGHLYAHGICDNSAGITAVLTFLDYIQTQNGLQKNYLIGFTVGEEALGAKRGMKGLLRDHGKKIRYVVNVESHNIGWLVDACIGQLRGRLKITARQKGAHSWHNFGEPNAAVVLAQIISEFSQIKMPKKSAYNITALKGGTAINAIPNEAECLFECRSDSPKQMDVIAARWQNIIKRHSRGGVTCHFEVLMKTEAASISKNHTLFTITQRELKLMRITPHFKSSNTDGDASLALGIPTITLGSSNGSATHSLNERLEKSTYPLGVEQVLQVLLALDKEQRL